MWACPAPAIGMVPQVHAKSIGSQEIRALLVARKRLLGRLLDVELSIRGILRGFGLKVGQVSAQLTDGPKRSRSRAILRFSVPSARASSSEQKRPPEGLR